MLDVLRNLFTRPVAAKSQFPLPEDGLQDVVATNRASLAEVENWIDENAFSNSCFQYGVPGFIKSEINKPVGSEITYTDLMVHISRTRFQRLNYLEIGVSVGKNFFQILNAHTQGTFNAFDIEEINPVLEKRLQFRSRDEWDTAAGSIKKTASSLKSYSFNQSEVQYLCADVWDEKSWARLKGRKFNMVFSDALHTPAAILFEFEMLVKYDLLDDKFVIFWDDLVGKMKNSFYRIIRKYDKKYQVKDIYLLSINGWVGQHEPPHTVGIISNFNL